MAWMALYCLGLLCVISLLPFWLDEVLELKAIESSSLSQLLHRVAQNAGGVPLDYCIRSLFTHTLGVSRFSARLPSLLSSLAAAVGVFAVAKRSAFRFPLVAVSIFCLMPLQVRYALEARPYETALALSIWATVVFRELVRVPSFGKAIAWGLLSCLCLYTQPFAIFPCVAHLIWFCCFYRIRANRRLYVYIWLPILSAGLAFLPWEIWAMRVWASEGQQHYSVGIKAISLILHELTGAGYWGTAVVAGLAIFAAITQIKARRDVSFWVLALMIPIGLTLAADSSFGYFLAIRQVVFMLPALSLVAAAGIGELSKVRPFASTAACIALGAMCLFANVSRIQGPHEDWEGPARKLGELSANPQTCVIFLPDSSAENYFLFEPGLRGLRCSSPPTTGAIALMARLPLENPRSYDRLSGLGYKPTRSFDFGGSTVKTFARDPSR